MRYGWARSRRPALLPRVLRGAGAPRIGPSSRERLMTYNPGQGAITCLNCGNQTPAGASFCPACGRILNTMQAPSSTSPAAPVLAPALPTTAPQAYGPPQGYGQPPTTQQPQSYGPCPGSRRPYYPAAREPLSARSKSWLPTRRATDTRWERRSRLTPRMARFG